MARVEKMWQREPWSTAGGTLHRFSRPGVSADTMTPSSGHKSLKTYSAPLRLHRHFSPRAMQGQG